LLLPLSLIPVSKFEIFVYCYASTNYSNIFNYR
jgi:hypothetical protein